VAYTCAAYAAYEGSIAQQPKVLQFIYRLGSCNDFFTLLACIISGVAACFLYQTLKSQQSTTERETFMRMVDSFERYVQWGQIEYFQRIIKRDNQKNDDENNDNKKQDDISFERYVQWGQIKYFNRIKARDKKSNDDKKQDDISNDDLFNYMLRRLKLAERVSDDDKKQWKELNDKKSKEEIFCEDIKFFIKIYKKEIHSEYRDFLSAYFRQIFHLIKFADDKKSLDNLLKWFRSKFSDYARTILMFNSICGHIDIKDGKEKYELLDYLRKYEFFEYAELAFPSIQERIMDFISPEKKQ
jgi:hypothetical protein